MSSARRSFCSRPRAWPMTSSRHAWTPLARSSASGASVSTTLDYLASRRSLEAGGQPAFPPSVVVEVKALACELPRRREVPLARWSVSELRREVVAQGVVAQISGTPLARDPARASGVRALRRRKDEHPGPVSAPPVAAARAWSTAAGRTRVRSGWRLGLYRRRGCASRAGVRPLRSQDRHRALRAAR